MNLVYCFFLSVYVQSQYRSDGRCGIDFDNSICDPNGEYGGCCSSYGYCGTTDDHCAIKNCQSGCKQSFEEETKNNERCGYQFKNTTCGLNNVHGQCCSEYGYCGSSFDHCNQKTCQSGCNYIQKLEKTVLSNEFKCGDNICNESTENCSSCPQDCGACKVEYIERCTKPGVISMTFDDGPTEYTQELLDVLERNDVKAAFFVLGHKLKNGEYRQMIRKAFDKGHTIASHTYDHPYISRISLDELNDQMNKTDNEIYKLINKRPVFMRNPYGDTDDLTLRHLFKLGYYSIFTSLDTRDTEVYQSDPESIYANVEKLLESSDPKINSFVMTQHDTLKQSVDKVESIIKLVREKGYKLVTIEECRGIESPYRNSVCGDGICEGYLENYNTCCKDCGSC